MEEHDRPKERHPLSATAATFDPLVRYCRSCRHYDLEGCGLMRPACGASERLRAGCAVDLEAEAGRQVRRQARQLTDPAEEATLVWEVRQGFAGLGEETFGDPVGAGRLVVALLRVLAWRRYADLVARERGGRRKASDCRWFRRVARQGALCSRVEPPLLLSQPQTCPTQDCFTPYQAVALEQAATLPAQTLSPHPALEEEQIQTRLRLFLHDSPVLYDLFARLVADPAQQSGTIKQELARQHGVSVRTIEHWRQRAATLFMALYTGALEQLQRQEPPCFAVVAARDFDPRYPFPSSLCAFGQIGERMGLPVTKVRGLYREGWVWLRRWMMEHGYPEASHLRLPIEEEGEQS